MQNYLSLREGYFRDLSLVATHRYGGSDITDTKPLYIYLLIFAFLCHFLSSKSILSTVASFLAELEVYWKIQPQFINGSLARSVNFGLFGRQMVIYPLIYLIKIYLSCISVRKRYKKIYFWVPLTGTELCSCICAQWHAWLWSTWSWAGHGDHWIQFSISYPRRSATRSHVSPSLTNNAPESECIVVTAYHCGEQRSHYVINSATTLMCVTDLLDL